MFWILYLRISSIAWRFCLSCQVGDGSTGVILVVRPRRFVCNGENGCRISPNGSNGGGGTNGRSSKALGNGGRISPSLVVGGNWDIRWKKRNIVYLIEGHHLTSWAIGTIDDGDRVPAFGKRPP